MRRNRSQQEILQAIANDACAAPDAPVTDITIGNCLAAVSARYCGLASLVSHIAPGLTRAAGPGDALPPSARQLAATLADPAVSESDDASLAMAAVNALLPPPAQGLDCPGQDLMLSRGKGKKVAIVGHFPFVDALRAVCDTLWVLEKRPRPGDVPAEMAGELLPQADVVAVTGTTLLNGTLAGLLASCRDDAFVVMLGPTTPYAPALFECGIDVLAGCAVPDPEAALSGIRAGRCFKGLSGVSQTVWARPGLDI